MSPNENKLRRRKLLNLEGKSEGAPKLEDRPLTDDQKNYARLVGVGMEPLRIY
uniref:Uncharacterized protein n=1 Tax=viral metagenome TaxID=1070528 RepID=A0A6M3LCT6_9ZZZZ